MVFGFMKRGWATKPPISEELYVRVLNEALLLASEYRDMDDIYREFGFTYDSDITENDVRLILGEVQSEFNQLESAARNLEEIKPRTKELMDVHVATIGFLRATLLVQDRFTMGVIEGVQGKERQANKRMKEVEKWARALEETRELLSKKLSELRRKRPDLFSPASLSPGVLEALGLW
jgi:hypothetical protein